MRSKNSIETDICSFYIDNEGILRMKIRDGVKINAEEVKEIYSSIKKLTGGTKVLELIENGNFYTFDTGGQKYAALHGKDLFVAVAMISRSSGLRLLFNFFNSFFKHPVPFKMFASETKALVWLRKFRKP